LQLGREGIVHSFGDPGTFLGFALKATKGRDSRGRPIYNLDTQSFSTNSQIDPAKLGFGPVNKLAKRNPSAARPHDVFLPDFVEAELVRRLERDFPRIHVVRREAAADDQ
jgi:hypothetical protein